MTRKRTTRRMTGGGYPDADAACGPGHEGLRAARDLLNLTVNRVTQAAQLRGRHLIFSRLPEGALGGNELPIGAVIGMVGGTPEGELDPDALPWDPMDGGAAQAALDTIGAESQAEDGAPQGFGALRVEEQTLLA